MLHIAHYLLGPGVYFWGFVYADDFLPLAGARLSVVWLLVILGVLVKWTPGRLDRLRAPRPGVPQGISQARAASVLGWTDSVIRGRAVRMDDIRSAFGLLGFSLQELPDIAACFEILVGAYVSY